MTNGARTCGCRNRQDSWARLCGRIYQKRSGITCSAAQCRRQPSCWVSCCSGRLPLSPAHLDRTAARAASGDVNGAVKDYLSQADSIASSQSRGEALWRAAVLTHVAKSEPQTAVSMLERLIEIFPEHPRVVDAHARIAMIERHHDGDAIRAGMRWVAAASIDPGHVDAGRWMLDAGLAFADAGDFDKALSALRVASTRPTQAVAAHLAQGRIHLQRDPGAGLLRLRRRLPGGRGG